MFLHLEHILCFSQIVQFTVLDFVFVMLVKFADLGEFLFSMDISRIGGIYSSSHQGYML